MTDENQFTTPAQAAPDTRKEPDMNTETHTELPWRLGPARNIVNRKGYFVANVQLGQSSSNFSEMDANAKLIVRAVNSHDALVAALREAKEFADAEYSDCNDLNRKHRISHLCDKIDAALSSIGGGKSC